MTKAAYLGEELPTKMCIYTKLTCVFNYSTNICIEFVRSALAH